MLKTQAKVKEMMEALELPLPNEEAPGIDNINYKLLRELVKEEAEEFNVAMIRLQSHITTGGGCGVVGIHLWAEVIDAMCDLIVVIHNTSNAMGLDLEPFFDEVHRSNMAKAGGPKRRDGKALKPKGWEPPQLKRMLENLVFGSSTEVEPSGKPGS